MNAATPRWSAQTMHVRHSRGVGVTCFVLVATLFFLVIARATAPKPFAVAVMLILLTVFAWAVKPIVGVCATVGFALIADNSTAGWYPFVKGFSARESILYLSDGVIVSPMEVVLLGAVLALVGRYLVLGDWPFSIGKLPYAMAGFTAFMFIGLANGVRTGADTTIALSQGRPFFVLALVYILVSSVCRTSSDYRALLWSIIAAIGIQSVISTIHFSGLTHDELKQTESLIDHSSAMRMDLLIVVCVASWLFAGASRRLRWVSTLLLLPVGWVYLVAERRAAVVGLVGAFGLMAVVLFWHRRKRFMKLVPAAGIVLAGYVGAFWNSQGTIAFPAQAVKSVISPGAVSDRNQSSDLYRVIENLDLYYTIQSNRIKGIGLGNPFLRPYPLPALSSGFKLAAYVPHNSFLWIWVATGFGGFAAMIFLVGRAVSIGAAKLRTITTDAELVVLLSFVLGVVIFTIFSYVDIAWDVGNMTLLGACIAVCANHAFGRGTLGTETAVAAADADVAEAAPADAAPETPATAGAWR